MPLPTSAMVHIDQPLTQISIAYIQNAMNFVADKAFPTIAVPKQSDRYFTYNKSDFFRAMAQKRGPGAESAGGGYRITNTESYFADVYAAHMDVDPQVRANADQPLRPDEDAAVWCTQQMLLKREIQWAFNYFKAGVWANNITGVAGAPGGGQFRQWNEDEATPIKDITNQMVVIAAATGFKPNCLVVSPHVHNYLCDSPDILDRVKYTQKASITEEMLAGLFGVGKYLVAWGVQESGKEGGSSSIDFIMSKGALLCYANPSPAIMQPSAGYIFAWTGLDGAGAYGNRIIRLPMDHLGLGTERVEGEIAFDAKLVASDLGCFFATAVA